MGGIIVVSTYHGIETGRGALTFFRKAMEISGVNISNADKDGYSRQVVNASAAPALSTGTEYSMLGAGVGVTSIERMRDIFLDGRLSRAEISQAYWSTMKDGMDRVEKFIVDISQKGINNYFESFWTSIQDVHTSPNDEAIRSYFLSETDNLSVFANSMYNTYHQYRDELNLDIKAMVEEANSLIDQISVITRSIRTVMMAGAEPNELLDKRDLLADKLCRLTGAEASRPLDETDGDYKINLNGKLLVQGSNTRHLVLVENPANNNYYEVQIEYNQYDITSDPDVAAVIIERGAASQGTCSLDGTHEMDVMRTADEFYWTVGYGSGQPVGARITGVKDAAAALNIDGSFALQVGSAGVRAFSDVFSSTPPGQGIVLGPLGPGETPAYTFRVAAGSFEVTINLEWDETTDPANPRWNISDNLGNSSVSTGAGGALSVEDLGGFMAVNYAQYGLDVKYKDDTLVLESVDRQLMSITDLGGDLMRSCGLSNDNPIVRIDVTAEDSLQTIANKINNAYMFDRTYEIDEDGNEKLKGNLKYETDPPGTSPDSPEEWLHASVMTDENGDCYLVLTSNVAGEAGRINVMSGSVCGGGVTDMTVARLLGLVDDDIVTGQTDVTSCIRFDETDGSLIDRYDPLGDVYVDDAWFVVDGNEWISASNDFKEARGVAKVGNAPADVLEEFTRGIRASLNGVGHTTILVRQPLSQGEIFANIKLRDDILLGQMDVFDDMMYKLATEFNAIHYAGYGGGSYSQTTGMKFFEEIKNKYGAFGKLSVDPTIAFDESRLATGTGDGNGYSLGAGDGTNALSIARLKQAKLFEGGTASFDDLYGGFVAEMGSFAALAESSRDAEDYIVEQITVRRDSIMGVNADEEMLKIVEMNQGFNYASQYISNLFQVLDTIINSMGRVGI
jgi:flagellar hook-associated protein 1 FlgK